MTGAGVRAPGQLRAPADVLGGAAGGPARGAARAAAAAPHGRAAAPDGVLHHVRGVRRQVGGGGLPARALRPRLLLRHLLHAVPLHRRKEDRRLQGLLLQR